RTPALRLPLLSASQSRRRRPAGRPVEQLDRVQNRNCRARSELRQATDIAGGDDLRLGLDDIRKLALEEAAGQLRLQQIIGPCRAAAEMALGHIEDGKPGTREKRFRR